MTHSHLKSIAAAGNELDAAAQAVTLALAHWRDGRLADAIAAARAAKQALAVAEFDLNRAIAAR